jgi:uncharacterized membrane protein (DUF2068 family)
VFEAFKGTMVLLLQLGLLALVHKDLPEVAEHLVRALHLNPDKPLSHAIVHAASTMTDARLWAIACAGLAYTAVRYIEAYGLWNRRVWAEWFALLSGGMYLPWEIFEFAQRATPLRAAVLVTNLIIVIYMLFIRVSASRRVGEPAS